MSAAGRLSSRWGVIALQVNGQAETALALQGELGRSVGLEAAMAEELQALRTKLERSNALLASFVPLVSIIRTPS